jgi:hypothetical protein
VQHVEPTPRHFHSTASAVDGTNGDCVLFRDGGSLTSRVRLEEQPLDRKQRPIAPHTAAGQSPRFANRLRMAGIGADYVQELRIEQLAGADARCRAVAATGRRQLSFCKCSYRGRLWPMRALSLSLSLVRVGVPVCRCVSVCVCA